MISILINAYACSPNMGSEPGMAWNWCVHLAKYCELHIITEGEFRDNIEAALPVLPYGGRLHFYYNPVSDEVRRMCWNQGDWRFYKYYRKWQWKTYLMANEICLHEHIDVLHQLNMIGFREPGYLWKLSKETNIPFVWGPIGGLKQFPLRYASGGGLKLMVAMAVKNAINILQLKFSRRVDAALRQASWLISSIPDSQRAIKKHKGYDSVVIPETGCTSMPSSSVDTNSKNVSNGFRILWVGKFDFRKRLDLALRAFAAACHEDATLVIYGTGNDKQVAKAYALAKDLGIDGHVEWMGSRPNSEVKEDMKRANLFLFTSVSEDTSTVVLEAVENGLPVLCFDACGMAAVIDEQVGKKVKLTNTAQSVRDFAAAIESLYRDRAKLKELSANCSQRADSLSWNKKAEKVVEQYKQILKDNETA